jgi:teichuronic acid biosynthesis glycosyltransferase TuaG
VRRIVLSPDPLISIIMPAFNASKTIALSIDSVLRQKYRNWELLIINDASIDDTFLIAESYAERDPRIKIINHVKNQGVAKSRNLGLEARLGGYIAFLDSDDLWLDNKLSSQVKSLEFDTVFSYMPYSFIDSDGLFLRNYMPPKSVTYKSMLLGNPLGTLTVMLDSNYLGNLKFPIRGHEDYALWLSLLRKGGAAKMAGDGESYARYRVHNSSLTSSKLRTASWQWKIYRESEGLSVLTSTALMFSYTFKAIQKRI